MHISEKEPITILLFLSLGNKPSTCAYRIKIFNDYLAVKALSILGIKKGIVVITKTDLVEPDFVELVQEDISELVKGTFLENAPMIPVSVYEKQGLDELKQVLKQMCDSLPERGDAGHFRLPIDRVFSLKGFGTVVTGT